MVPPGWCNEDLKGIHLKRALLLITTLSVFQTVELQSLWKDQPVVLFFLRRFGCQICRWIAAEISKLEPDLRASGVALVGIGPEEFGLKEFKDGGFFKGSK